MRDPKPIATAALHRKANLACEKFQGRALRLSFIAGPKPRWIAEVLPEEASITRRLVHLGLLKGDPTSSRELQVHSQHRNKPVAKGEGATQLEAIDNLLPEKWI
jgi:hypothetical protein